MVRRLTQILPALLLAAGTACGGLSVDDSPSTRTSAAPSAPESGASKTPADRTSETDALDEDRGASAEERFSVAVRVPVRLRDRLRAVEFVPVSEVERRESITVDVRSRERPEAVRLRVPEPGAYDVVFRVDRPVRTGSEAGPFGGSASGTLSAEGDDPGERSERFGDGSSVRFQTYRQSNRETESSESEGPDEGVSTPIPGEPPSGESGGERREGETKSGDPVPVPADPLPERPSGTRQDGETSDGDPVPVPAEPLPERPSGTRQDGETSDGDPVPVPAEPADYRVDGSSGEIPFSALRIFESAESWTFVVPNVELTMRRPSGPGASPRIP